MNNSKEYQEIRDIFKEVGKMFKETNQRFKETDQRFKETDKLIKEIAEERKIRQKEIDKQIKELGKQIGGLGRKFGFYTEGLAIPSIKKILINKFKVVVVTPRILSRRNGNEMEIDVLGYANKNINKAYLVEIKSKLNSSEINSTLKNVKRFFKFFPEHQNKELYGIIAAVDFTPTMKEKVLKSGLYFAVIHDDLFQLDIPENFIPKVFKSQ